MEYEINNLFGPGIGKQAHLAEVHRNEVSLRYFWNSLVLSE